MLEINNIKYELKYSVGRIKMIEEALQGASFMALMVNSKGMLSISQLENFLAFGLRKVGSDTYIDVSEALMLADRLIETRGYAELNLMVINAVQRDCPFFFQAV